MRGEEFTLAKEDTSGVLSHFLRFFVPSEYKCMCEGLLDINNGGKDKKVNGGAAFIGRSSEQSSGIFCVLPASFTEGVHGLGWKNKPQCCTRRRKEYVIEPLLLCLWRSGGGEQ